MSLPFDATLKEILGSHPGDLRDVFSLPAIEPATLLNVDLSTLSAATDVALGFGSPLQEIVDMNFQSGPDTDVVARLFLYNAALFLKFKVPVRSLLILLRTKAEISGLDGRLAYAASGKRVEFEYDVVRLWHKPVDVFLHGGLGLLPLAPLCQMPKDKPLVEELREVVREIDSRLAKENDRPLAARLMTAAFILAGMRIEKQNLGKIFDGVKIMHESTAYDTILDEGRAEGRIEGRLEGQKELLLLLGRRQLGSLDAGTEAALKSIKDSERLKRMILALSSVKSWSELVAIP